MCKEQVATDSPRPRRSAPPQVTSPVVSLSRVRRHVVVSSQDFHPVALAKGTSPSFAGTASRANVVTVISRTEISRTRKITVRFGATNRSHFDQAVRCVLHVYVLGLDAYPNGGNSRANWADCQLDCRRHVANLGGEMLAFQHRTRVPIKHLMRYRYVRRGVGRGWRDEVKGGIGCSTYPYRRYERRLAAWPLDRRRGARANLQRCTRRPPRRGLRLRRRIGRWSDRAGCQRGARHLGRGPALQLPGRRPRR